MIVRPSYAAVIVPSWSFTISCTMEAFYNEFKEYVKTVSDVLLSITASADDIIGNDPKGDSITSFFKKIFDFLRNLIEKILAIFKL